MLDMLRTAAIAGMVGLAALAAVPAKADGHYRNHGHRHDHARFGIFFGDGGMYFPHGSSLDGYRFDDRIGERRCTPERALYKAESIGVHRARIDYVSQHEIGIVGRRHGDRVHLTFARAPSCPIIG